MFSGILNERLKNCTRSRLLVGRLLAVAGLACVLARAEPQTPHRPAADDGADGGRLVHEALAAEVDGRSRDRDHWAARRSSSTRPVLPRWLDGRSRLRPLVKDRADAGLDRRSDRTTSRYLHERSKCSDTAEDQYQLGTWCEKQRLKEQARAHFTRAIQLDPDHAAARGRLGYALIAGQWQSVGETPADRRAEKEAAEPTTGTGNHAWSESANCSSAGDPKLPSTGPEGTAGRSILRLRFPPWNWSSGRCG